MKSLLATGLLLLCISMSSSGQDTLRKTPQLKVFLNCSWCYQPYLKTQITWADFVQDQFVADVDLIVADISTGSGGIDYTLYFNGKKKFAGMQDTLRFATSVINTEAEIREMMAQQVKLGLVRYAVKAGIGGDLIISCGNEEDLDDMGIGSNPDEDPFNAWVFRVSGNMDASAQKIFQSGYFNGSIGASQVKEDFKLNTSFGFTYSEQRFELDGEKESFILRGQYGSLNYVRAINEKWSAGVFNYASISDFSNYDYYQNSNVGIEYNFFPYKQAQTKLATLNYTIGGSYFNFQDTTIYGKTVTFVPSHSLNLGTSFTQTWGSLSAGGFAASFLNDFEKYRFGGWLNTDVRLFKGFSVSSYVSYNVVRDQINIRKGGASDEEILLEQKELQTSFNFYTYVGLSYRFGSIYNNVVNPRFDYGG